MRAQARLPSSYRRIFSSTLVVPVLAKPSLTSLQPLARYSTSAPQPIPAERAVPRLNPSLPNTASTTSRRACAAMIPPRKAPPHPTRPYLPYQSMSRHVLAKTGLNQTSHRLPVHSVPLPACSVQTRASPRLPNHSAAGRFLTCWIPPFSACHSDSCLSHARPFPAKDLWWCRRLRFVIRLSRWWRPRWHILIYCSARSIYCPEDSNEFTQLLVFHLEIVQFSQCLMK